MISRATGRTVASLTGYALETIGNPGVFPCLYTRHVPTPVRRGSRWRRLLRAHSFSCLRWDPLRVGPPKGFPSPGGYSSLSLAGQAA
jgi:hypothetical protein